MKMRHRFGVSCTPMAWGFAAALALASSMTAFAQTPPKSEGQAAPAGGIQRIRIGGNVQQARMIAQPKPEYPPLARQARIEGTVKLQIIVAKDGSVLEAQVLSGHPLLVQAAIDAVKQWKYQPTLLNGQPVEVVTPLDVTFTLSQPTGVPAPLRVRVAGNVQRARLVTQTEPAYPDNARIRGTVRLQAVIATDGSVKELTVLSGHPLLVTAAIGAVQQWKYQPTLYQGQPVEVFTTIDVSFRFPKAQR